MRRTLQRLLALVRRRRLDAELEGEVQAHLELAEHDAIERGLPPAAARLEALRQFGGVLRFEEEHRDVRSVNWIENILRDLRLGTAALRRDPAFAAVAIGVLALGIGANAAMFSLLDAVLFRPPPFPQPERMVKIYEAPSRTGRNSVNTLDFLDWKRMAGAFEAMAAESDISVTLTGQGEPDRLPGKRVSAAYFRVFATNPQLGRVFRSDEDQPGAAPVIVLSNAAWRARFAGDPTILNRLLILDGEPHRVVGVLPAGPFDRVRAVFWKPLIFTPAQRTRDFHWLLLTARLHPGVTVEQARQELAAIDERLKPLSPYWKREWGVAVLPFAATLVGDGLRQSIQAAFGAVLLVLLIACANIANLLLAKGAARAREMSVRAALGASRARLVGQLLTETLVLCAVGGLAGAAIAFGLIRAAVHLFGDSLPFTAGVEIDWRVLAFTAFITLAVTLASGLLPSLQVARNGIAPAMNQGARGSSQAREGIRRLIVTTEVALSLVLICGALLLLKTLANLQSVNTGIHMENIIAMEVELPLSRYPASLMASQFFRSVIERLNAAPGISHAAVASDPPLEEVGEGMAMLAAASDKDINIRYKRVSPEYFRTVGIAVIAGREFSSRDRAGAPSVVIVNQALAHEMARTFELANPVGHKVRMVTPHWVNLTARLETAEIVGIIRSELTGDPRSPQDRVAYIPYDQVPVRRASFVVRTSGELNVPLAAIRQTVREFDPNLALGSVRSIQQIRRQSLAGASQPAFLIGAFATLAMLLAALGLYGVLSHAVTQQRREIGIRLALGASPSNVVGRVLQEALAMIAVGLMLGLAGAWALTRAVQGLLFQVPALDPAVLLAGCIAMAFTGAAAAFVPSLRASRIEPVRVLREDG